MPVLSYLHQLFRAEVYDTYRPRGSEGQNCGQVDTWQPPQRGRRHVSPVRVAHRPRL